MKHVSLIFLVLILFSGCSYQGTGTGNPISPPQASATNGSYASLIFTNVCKVISSCHSETTQDACWLGIETATNFANHLGVSIVPEPTVYEIIGLESSGALISNGSVATSCLTKLWQLTCDDTNVQNAYRSSDPNPFNLAAEVLDPICKTLF